MTFISIFLLLHHHHLKMSGHQQSPPPSQLLHQQQQQHHHLPPEATSYMAQQQAQMANVMMSGHMPDVVMSSHMMGLSGPAGQGSMINSLSGNGSAQPAIHQAPPQVASSSSGQASGLPYQLPPPHLMFNQVAYLEMLNQQESMNAPEHQPPVVVKEGWVHKRGKFYFFCNCR